MLHVANHRRLLRAGFRTRQVPTDHGDLVLYDAKGGEPRGPTVVLVHGVSSRASSWTGVALKLLGHCRRIVMPDLLGHGESHLPSEGLRVHTLDESLRSALDDVVPEQMMLVGNSMGSFMAALFAAERRWRVQGLVLSNPGGAPLPEEVFRQAVSLLTPASPLEALQLARAGSSFTSPLILGVGALAIHRRMKQPHIRAFLETARADESLEADHLRRLDMPVLLVTGLDDGVIPAATLQWYRDNLPPQGEVREVDGYGHAPMSERPRVMAGILRGFLKRVAAAPSHRPALPGQASGLLAAR